MCYTGLSGILPEMVKTAVERGSAYFSLVIGIVK